MNLVFDTDILSTFGKIRRLDLLRVLLPNARLFIPHSVYNELFKARERGYEFVDYIIESGILEVTLWENWKVYLSASSGNTFLLQMT
jgi:hypothetical protein